MLRRSVVGFVVVALSTLAHGHHSTLGFYDPDRIMEIEGTLK